MDDPVLHLSISHACKMLGKLDDALRYAREAIQLYPKNPKPYMVVGDLCDCTGQVKQAEYNCRQALLRTQSQDCTDKLSTQEEFLTLCCLGSNLLWQGSHKEAETFLVRASQLSNSSPLAYKH